MIFFTLPGVSFLPARPLTMRPTTSCSKKSSSMAVICLRLGSLRRSRRNGSAALLKSPIITKSAFTPSFSSSPL